MPRTYEPISSTTLTGNSTSVNFTSIPATYTDLVVVCSIFSDGTADPSIQVNGDTATNYSNTILTGNGTSASSGRNSNVAYVRLGESAYVTSTTQGLYIVHIMNYSNTTTNKTFISRNNNAATGVDAIVSLWRSTNAITSVNVYSRGGTPPNFTSGSTFTLYGIESA